MSNAAGATATREEEIAFLAMEQVLRIDIKLADAGAGDRMPDGSWVYPDGQKGRGIVEVTSPPAARLLTQRARAKKAGLRHTESGSISLLLNQLAQVCNEMLAADWARENINKLLAQPADERHLFLFGRSHKEEHYFYRLSDPDDEGKTEPVDDLVLPEGISDVWFRGRARRDRGHPGAPIELRLARFHMESGWHRYVVRIEDLHLPTPNQHLADDRVPAGLRHPKDRSTSTADD
ncbi:hypothetical protein [Longispora urticae]